MGDAFYFDFVSAKGTPVNLRISDMSGKSWLTLAMSTCGLGFFRTSTVLGPYARDDNSLRVTSTVGDIKFVIAEHCGIKQHEQKLLYQNRILADDEIVNPDFDRQE